MCTAVNTWATPDQLGKKVGLLTSLGKTKMLRNKQLGGERGFVVLMTKKVMALGIKILGILDMVPLLMRVRYVDS